MTDEIEAAVRVAHEMLCDSVTRGEDHIRGYGREGWACRTNHLVIDSLAAIARRMREDGLRHKKLADGLCEVLALHVREGEVPLMVLYRIISERDEARRLHDAHCGKVQGIRWRQCVPPWRNP